jgi:hypothetical protein
MDRLALWIEWSEGKSEWPHWLLYNKFREYLLNRSVA